MAKGKKDKKKQTNQQWLDAMMMPSRQQYQQYVRGQQQQYNPLINLLTAQIRGQMNLSQDPVVQQYERLSAGLPTEQAVSERYQQGLQNLAGFMRDINVARGGQGVTEAVQGIAGAIGAEPGAAQDVAQAAGAVSGVGGGQDILSQAILGGAASQFAATEAERLGEIAGQRQQFTMGAAEARRSAREQRQELARMLAKAKGERLAARPNPLETAGLFLSYQAALDKLRKSGRGGTGTGVAATVGGGGGGTGEPTPMGQGIGVAGTPGYIPSIGEVISAEAGGADVPWFAQYGVVTGGAPASRPTGGGGGAGFAAQAGAQGQRRTGTRRGAGPRGGNR